MLDVRFQPMADRVKCPIGRQHYLRSPFKARTGLDDLERELSLLKATDIVIESGHQRTQIRNDGWPRGGTFPAHHDVRLFFQSKHGPLRYECNAFDSWEANLRAIGLWLQRTRLAIEEWGVGTGGEAYRGFAALPAGASAIAAAEWASVEDAMRYLARVAMHPDALNAHAYPLTDLYRAASRKAHPDAGGSTELMIKVNRAKDFIDKHGGAA